MKIGIFTDTYYPETNGVATSAFLLKKELESRGNEVYVFTVSNPHMTEREEHVYRMKSIPFVLLQDRRVGCALFKKWVEIARRLALDVIHTQTEFTVGRIGRKAAAKLGIPLIHTYHTIYEDYTHYLKLPGNENLKGIVGSASRFCCDKAELVIVPTEKVKKLLIGYGVSKPILVQPTGICVEKFGSVEESAVLLEREKYGLTREHHVLISVGRLAKEKNLGELISYTGKLIEKDPVIRLVIVGGGSQQEQLMRQVRKLHLEKYIIFTGEVKWKNVQNYYALGDVFVSCSTSETQGLTYVEALAAGKPLLVRADDCLKEVLSYGVNGYSFVDASSFIEAAEQLFHQETYLAMKNEARTSAEKFSAKRFGKNMDAVYADLCKMHALRGETKIYEQRHVIAG